MSCKKGLVPITVRCGQPTKSAANETKPPIGTYDRTRVFCLPPRSQAPGWRCYSHGGGKTSFYGKGFEGKPMACGGVFDSSKSTAAHKKLPCGTRVRATDILTGESVIVTITDRGPYKPGRIIDLSQSAAAALGILEKGLADVRIDIIP